MHLFSHLLTASPRAQATNSRPLWQTRLREDFKQNAIQQIMPGALLNPKQAYLERRREFVREQVRLRQLAEQQREEERKQQLHQERQQFYGKFSAVHHFCAEPLLTCCFAPCFIVGAILIVLRLTKGETIQWDDLAPIIAMVSLITLVVVCTCYHHYAERPIPFADDTFENSQSAVKEMVRAFGERESGRHGFVCLNLLLVLLCFIFLCLRVTRTVTWAYTAVFSPVFAVGFLFIIMPCLFRQNREAPRIALALWGAALAPTMTFVVLLARFLDGDDSLKLSYVLIPLFIWDFCALMLALFLLLRENGKEPIAFFCVAAMPMVVFEILLCVFYDDASSPLSYATLFIPFFIWTCPWLVGSVGIGANLVSARTRARPLTPSRFAPAHAHAQCKERYGDMV